MTQKRQSNLLMPNTESFVNHSTPPGTAPGPEGFAAFFEEILRPAFPDLTVEIHDQIAEGDKVATRKTLRGTHGGPFLGVPATHRAVTLRVTDIVRLRGGRYVEHWGSADLYGLMAQISPQ